MLVLLAWSFTVKPTQKPQCCTSSDYASCGFSGTTFAQSCAPLKFYYLTEIMIYTRATEQLQIEVIILTTTIFQSEICHLPCGGNSWNWGRLQVFFP
jgi:hypothetical protein